MYGLIHRGLRAMVLERAGQDAWAAVERQVGAGPTEFISAMVYEDALTLRLVGAVAERLEITTSDCLRDFGRHWIGFAENSPYGSILDFTGDTLEAFIGNLDRMHQSVRIALPSAQVPSFKILHVAQDRLVVRYASQRSGLESFVTGLLEGVLARFGLTGSVSRRDTQADGGEVTADCDVVFETSAVP